jgi:flagellar motor switch protein FliN/FliY
MSENSELNNQSGPSQSGGSGFTEEISAKIAEVTHRPMKPMEIEREQSASSLDMLWGVHLTLTVELGRTSLTVRQVIELQKGSVVELDRIAGEAVDIFVNDRLIAKGDVVVVDDKFGVRITELISPIQE